MSKPKKREINIDDFVADMCDIVGGMGIWRMFLEEMQQRGYEESEVDAAFKELNERAGRDY